MVEFRIPTVKHKRFCFEQVSPMVNDQIPLPNQGGGHKLSISGPSLSPKPVNSSFLLKNVRNLNTALAWCLNGPKLFNCQMVCFSSNNLNTKIKRLLAEWSFGTHAMA